MSIPEPVLSESDKSSKQQNTDIATLRFQLPRGKKISRNFFKSDKMQRVIDYLTLFFYEEDGDVTKNFVVSIPYPKAEVSDMEKTVDEMVGVMCI